MEKSNVDVRRWHYEGIIKALVAVLPSLAVSSCFLLAPSESEPSFREVQGVYYAVDKHRPASLILACDADFNEHHATGPYGQYVLVVMDSLNSERIERGFWDYIIPPDKSADYSIGPDGYSGLRLTPFSNRKFLFEGLAHFELVNGQKRLIVGLSQRMSSNGKGSTLLESLLSSGKSVSFERVSSTKRY